MRKKVLFLTIIILAVIRVFCYQPVKYNNGAHLKVKGTITEEPIRFGQNTQVKLSGIKVYFPFYEFYSLGDYLIVEGIYKKGVLYNPKIISYNKNTNIIYVFHDKIIDFYYQNLPKKAASLLSGMVMGARANMGEYLWDIFIKTGTAHIVVASGTNVIIIIKYLLSVLLKLVSRRRAVIITLIFIWFYAFMLSFQAPIVRASLMASAVYMAKVLGKKSYESRVFIISFLVMVFVNPKYFYELSFWMSYLSLFGVMTIGTSLSSILSKKVPLIPYPVAEGFATSLGAYIYLFPIQYFIFGNINIYSPAINALVLWMVPIITIVGMVGGLVGFIIPFAGRMVLYLIYPFVYIFLSVLELCGRIL